MFRFISSAQFQGIISARPPPHLFCKQSRSGNPCVPSCVHWRGWFLTTFWKTLVLPCFYDNSKNLIRFRIFEYCQIVSFVYMVPTHNTTSSELFVYFSTSLPLGFPCLSCSRRWLISNKLHVLDFVRNQILVGFKHSRFRNVLLFLPWT